MPLCSHVTTKRCTNLQFRENNNGHIRDGTVVSLIWLTFALTGAQNFIHFHLLDLLPLPVAGTVRVRLVSLSICPGDFGSRHLPHYYGTVLSALVHLRRFFKCGQHYTAQG